MSPNNFTPKSASRGQSVCKNDVPYKQQFWQKLSVKGIQEANALELSLYPLTNQRKKDAEIKVVKQRIKKKKLEKMKAKPPPYNMLQDIMTKFNV